MDTQPTKRTPRDRVDPYAYIGPLFISPAGLRLLDLMNRLYADKWRRPSPSVAVICAVHAAPARALRAGVTVWRLLSVARVCGHSHTRSTSE